MDFYFVTLKKKKNIIALGLSRSYYILFVLDNAMLRYKYEWKG